MSDEDDTPTFALVKESGIDGQRKSLFLVLESTEGEHFRLDFTPGCIPLTVAALSAELGYLLSRQPDSQPMDVQPIVIQSSEVAEMGSGAPVIMATLEGGAELPLQMTLQSLKALQRQIERYLGSKALGTV